MAIYASTNYATRRRLWQDLGWIGDFNTIMGAHEYK